MTTHTNSPADLGRLPSRHAPRLPPRWFICSFWVLHRAAFAASRGRFGLRPATAERWGMLRLRTLGRHTGQQRSAILAYLEDGSNLIVLATNGMAEPTPAWWLNLQAHPEATVDLGDGSHAVRARVADTRERPRLWELWAALGGDLDGHAAARSKEIPVVILEPHC